MKRTTIMTDEQLLLEIRHLAASEGKTLTAVVREAFEVYLQSHRRARSLSFLGVGHGGQAGAAGDERTTLARAIDEVEGWSPRRPPDAPPPPPQDQPRETS